MTHCPRTKSEPGKLHLLVLRHEKSGAETSVEYLGMMGIPLRAQIWWPMAGDFLMSALTGRLLGSEERRHWRVRDQDRGFLRQEWALARARSGQPGKLTGMRSCRQ